MAGIDMILILHYRYTVIMKILKDITYFMHL